MFIQIVLLIFFQSSQSIELHIAGCSEILLSQIVVDRQLWWGANANSDLADVIETYFIMDGRVSQGLSKCLQRVLSDFFVLLEGLCNADWVVWTIAQGEERWRSGLVQLSFEVHRCVKAV